MRLLDLFCGAGGAAMGYYRAGFTDIVGVDIELQPHYPFEFVQGDALEYLEAHGAEFDLIHASPPCQAYSVTKSIWNREHPDMVKATRQLIESTALPYIIENVMGAPLINPLMLCGTMFGLSVKRHRLFECYPAIWFAPFTCKCANRSTGSHRGFSSFDTGELITVAGHNFNADDGRTAMGINWMTRNELSQAIPPVYTEWIGKQVLELI